MGLTACAESISSVEPPALEPPPASFVEACLRPVRLPNKEITQSEAESLWVEDRIRLISCAERHAALAEFYTERDREISNVE